MPNFTRLGLLTLAMTGPFAPAALAYDGVCRSAGDIDALQPGQWCRTSTNTIYDVRPIPTPPGGVGVSGMTAWSGGAYDTKRNRLLVWGGGDGDYAGNEIYAFDLATMQWSRIWGPTDVSLIPGQQSGSYEAYPDGNPGSRHTYDGVEYLPNVDVLWANGGSLWSQGAGGHYTWFFNPASPGWQRKADKSNGFLDAVSAYDPLTGHVFMNSYNTFYEYDPFSNVWTTRGGFSAGFPGGANAEIDPVSHKFLIVGASSWPGAGYVSYFDLNEAGNGLQLHPQATSGDNEITQQGHPGLAYDSSSRLLVAWNGTSGNTANIYTLNPATWTWRRVPPAASNLTIPTVAGGTGTLGRFRYIPSKNAFILVNGVTEPVYFYKLGSGSGTPADSVPPSAPADLRGR